MHDHGLFQAICRVNRLDGDDKDYGYIVDYQRPVQLARKRHHRLHSGALDGYDKKDVAGSAVGPAPRKRASVWTRHWSDARFCEPSRRRKTASVPAVFLREEPGNAEQLKANEPKRLELYKAVAAVARAYANLANEMDEAGYSEAEAEAIPTEVAHYAAVRDEVKLGAGEDVDFKQYELVCASCSTPTSRLTPRSRWLTSETRA